jgi:hypothetical protein
MDFTITAAVFPDLSPQNASRSWVVIRQDLKGRWVMKGKRFNTGQIINKLIQAEVLGRI